MNTAYRLLYLMALVLLSSTSFINAQVKTYILSPSDYLTSEDVGWDLSRCIIKGELPIVNNRRFSYSGEIEIKKDREVADAHYVILDHKFPPEIGMYEIRKDDCSCFNTVQGVYMACFNKSDSIVEIINVPCGYGARMQAIPLTEPMIKEKGITYIKFSIPKEGNYKSPVITNWGRYTILDDQKNKLYNAGIFADGNISTAYFRRLDNEKDDTGLLQAAINLAYWGKTLTITDRYYEVTKPLEVFYFQNIQMTSNAVISAGQEFDGKEFSNSVVEYDCGAARVQLYKGSDRYSMWVPYPDQPTGLFATERRGIRGGCIDGKGRANCIWISHGRGLTVDEVSLKNPRNYGLRVSGSQEMYISRCTCINTVESKERNTAFFLGSTDNMIRDCVAIDTNVGFYLASFTVANSLHHWIGMIKGKFEGSVSFSIVPQSTVLIGCYADTSETCYNIKDEEGCCSLIGCIAFSNPKMTTVKKITGIKAAGKGKAKVLGGNFDLKTSKGYESNVRLVEGIENVSFVDKQ